MHFELKKPDLSKINEDQIPKVLLGKDREEVFNFVKKVNEIEYLYWDKAKFKEPAPQGISKEELWKIVKFLRELQSRKTLIKSEGGKYFSWIKLLYYEEFLHEIDMNTGGELFAEKAEVDKRNKQN